MVTSRWTLSAVRQLGLCWPSCGAPVSTTYPQHRRLRIAGQRDTTPTPSAHAISLAQVRLAPQSPGFCVLEKLQRLR